jgi:hypothetical protein
MHGQQRQLHTAPSTKMARSCKGGDEMMPDDVRRFVLTSVPSVPHLEAIVLFQCEPQRERSCAEVARALYVPEALALELLDYLCKIECLCAPTGHRAGYSYAPRDEDMRALLEKVVIAYRTEMIGMTHLIHDPTQKSAQRFADAFRLKKDR